MKTNMKFVLMGIMLAAIAAVFTGCDVLFPSGPEFVGSWYYQVPAGGSGGVMATFTSTSFNLNSNAIELINRTGTMNTTITSYNEAENRMICRVNSVTGYYTSFFAAGNTMYVIYSVNGNQLQWNGQTGTYPAATGTNIYQKQ